MSAYQECLCVLQFCQNNRSDDTFPPSPCGCLANSGNKNKFIYKNFKFCPTFDISRRKRSPSNLSRPFADSGKTDVRRFDSEPKTTFRSNQ